MLLAVCCEKNYVQKVYVHAAEGLCVYLTFCSKSCYLQLRS